ncbi:MAG: diadenylate cyclase CdaA [Chloroflexota bacterium]
MSEFLSNLAANFIFILERLNWLSVVDILLVTAIFFGILQFLRGTQAFVLLRGILLLLALVVLLTSLDVLPAFSWLVQTTLPALLFSIPVIFAPEIRHALERLGRAGVSQPDPATATQIQDIIGSVVTASVRLSERQHGALIVLQRRDSLAEYVSTGVRLEARVTAELLLQIFYPNTPLHDGAVVIIGQRIVAASTVMPLSASGVLARSPDRKMGLRHRAALGISEASDAVAVVVSEETGMISVVHSGRIIRRLDGERLDNILRAFFQPARSLDWRKRMVRWFSRDDRRSGEDFS